LLFPPSLPKWTSILGKATASRLATGVE
jgi:hypothetical protein